MFPNSFKITGSRALEVGFFRAYPQHSQYNTHRPVDLTKVIRQFHNEFVDAVIENRHGAELPLLMGKFTIYSYKSRGYMDFARFKSSKQLSKFINTHTDGLTCRLAYESMERRYRFKDKSMWKFYPSVLFKKRVSEAFRANHSRYIYSPDKTSRYYDALDFKLKDINDRKIQEYLNNYDELYIE